MDKVALEIGPATVYNFEVADAHDYFVSDENVLVHDAPCLKIKPDTERLMLKDQRSGRSMDLLKYMVVKLKNGVRWRGKIYKGVKSIGMNIMELVR